MGYELHPATPPGGIPLSEYLPNAEGMLRYVRSFAEGFGIGDLVPPTVLAPTRRVLALAEHARDAGRLDRLREVAFDAYWRRGWGLETDEDLRWLSREAGLDVEAALAAARDPALLGRVAAARSAAAAAGVTGVPTFDFTREGGGAAARVVGCQRYEVLADAARRAGARRRRSPEREP